MAERYDDGLSVHPSRNLQAKQFGGSQSSSDDDMPFAPLSDSEKVELQEEHAQRFGGEQNQRAGQMKRAYHAQERKSIAEQNKPPAQPKTPRAPAQKRQAPPETKLLKMSKRLGTLARIAGGRR